MSTVRDRVEFADTILEMLGDLDRAQAEWASALEASTAAARSKKQASDDLDAALNAYAAQLSADGKNGQGPLAGIAATSKQFDVTLKAALASVQDGGQLTPMSQHFRQLDIKAENAAMVLEIAASRLAARRTMVTVMGNVARMLAE